MPEIAISDQTLAKVSAFMQVVEAVIDEKIAVDGCIELIIHQGINSMLDDLLGSVEAGVLRASLEQLGSEYPKEVYGFIAKTLGKGQVAQERERLKHKLGFNVSGNTERE